MSTSKIIPLAILCLGLSGCASTPDLSFMKMPKINLSSSSSEDSAKTLDQITAQYEKWNSVMANSDQMENYAPKSYQALLKQWKEVQDLYTQIHDKPELIDKKMSLISFSTYGDKFNESIADLGKTYTELSSTIVQANTLIPEAISEHAFLIDNALDKKSPDEFQRLDNKYQDLFDYISEGKSNKAKEYQSKYLESAFQYEVNVAKEQYAVSLTERISADKTNEMDKLAPQTLLTAESSIKSVYDSIKSNPRNSSLIKSLVTKAEFDLDHLEQVAQQVKTLANITEGQYEPTILDIETKLLAISKSVDGSDFRNKSLNSQMNSILNSVKILKDKVNEVENAQPGE